MSEWKEYKLGEICDVRDGTHDSPKETSNGYPLVTSKNIKNGVIDLSNTYLISESDYNLVNQRSKVEQWDVLFSMIGTIGESAIVKEQPNYAIKNVGLFKTRCNKLLAEWIYYYLHSQQAKSEINARLKGSTQQYISLADLRTFPIELPIIEQRHKIVSIFTSLDDKIDLLRRENATLEAMAETLFRQWFVEDAKKEWEEGKVADFSKHIKDSINPQRYPNTVFQHFSIPAYDDGKKPIIETGGDIQSNKYVIPQNCILFSKLNPHKDKRVWLILDDVPDNAICSTEFQIVKPINVYYLFFLYGWLTYKDNYEDIASGVGGTSGSHQRIDPKSIFSYACPNVDNETIRNYSEDVEPLFKKQINNQKQIQTLIQTRDMLLPRLMSGEIKI